MCQAFLRSKCGLVPLCNDWLVFAPFLSPSDCLRASESLAKLLACGLCECALTGGVAAELHLVAQGRRAEQRVLNDLDLVVESFEAIPAAIAEGFLLHHIHPHALEGKTLIQLIDEKQRLRIDLFRQFGSTLKRARIPEPAIGPLPLISLEDLVARTTSMVLGCLRRRHTIDVKHARTFRRLTGLGDPAKLETAWRDHRQEQEESFAEAAGLAQELLDAHPELVVREQYESEVKLCPECRDVGAFRRARPPLILQTLGYW